VVRAPIAPQLMADGGAGLLEVDAHDQEKPLLQFPCELCQTACIFEGGLGIVNGAGAYHHHQAAVAVAKNVGDLLPGPGDELGAGRGCEGCWYVSCRFPCRFDFIKMTPAGRPGNHSPVR
jgi:hypothetical protein